MQININNSVIELYNGIIRTSCKHIMLDLKYENGVPSVIKNEIKMSLILTKTIMTLTKSYSNLPNTLDIDLAPSYSTRHMYFGSTGIKNGP